jgi:HD superfamily phosphodiesterase
MSYNLEIYITTLSEFIDNHNRQNPDKQIDESHGITHMTTVLNHTENALVQWSGDAIGIKEIFKVKLAALLHDIDDSKYFSDDGLYKNAREILENVNTILLDEDINDIIQMIKWVSSSGNGDSIPDEAIEKEYLLYPRYADRLEAIGIIGLERTLQYTLHKAKKAKNAKYSDENGFITDIPELLFNSQTAKAKSGDGSGSNKSYLTDLYDEIATAERYNHYRGKSVSMMDHFYDKLLRLGKYPIRNIYFDIETDKRQKPLEYIAVEFSKRPNISEIELKELMESIIRGETF